MQTTTTARPRGEIKLEQKNLNKVMLKAIPKTHQAMRDLSSTVWDTLLGKASSPEAENVQKQTQTHAERHGRRDVGTLEAHHSCGLTWA